jgi:hypothetical protein
MKWLVAARTLGVGFLLAFAFGGGFSLIQAVGDGERVLGAQVSLASTSSAQTPMQVLRVIWDKEPAPVIIPEANVWRENGSSYVLTVQDNLVVKRAVSAESWRGRYAKITAGLADQDLIVVDTRASLGQKIEYQVINAEAGQSGLLQ